MTLDPSDSIVVLTGAGISAESGIRTFRDNDGLWEDHRIEDVATPEGFLRDPALVQRFYNLRRKQLQEPGLVPNAAHLALVKLEQDWQGDVLIVTQNVDDLHGRAGSKALLHMHGELNKVFCQSCHGKWEWLENLSTETPCPNCKRPASLRPDIVWFGEMPYHMDRIMLALARCKLFIAIGTSGLVYPAAGFSHQAHRALRIEINVQETGVSSSFDRHLIGSAGIEVPKLVDLVLAGEL
jgi:NAD-dependent deacetylase